MEEGKTPPIKVNGKNQDEHSAGLNSADTTSRNYTIVHVDGYDHGFTNGVFRLDRHAFPAFIEGLEQKKHASARLNSIRQELLILKERIENLWQEYNRHEAESIRNAHEAALLERQLMTKESQKRETKQRIELLEQERNGINPYYNWIVAAIFILAGLVFITADISITYQILNNGLDMARWEAIILAVGLAFTAFIVKPAVDRVFEEPYLTGENKKLNHRFLLVVGALALISLGFMGYYRNVAMQFNEQYKEVSASIQENQRSLEGALEDGSSDQIGQLRGQQRDLRRAQFGHWAIMATFTMSSILFALAGAICFSIGLPVTNLLYKKRLLGKTIKKYMEELGLLVKDLEETGKQLTERKIAHMQSEKLLERFPVIPFLEEKLETLKTAEAAALADYYAQTIKTEQAWYEAGFLRGQKYKLAGELVFKPVYVRPKPVDGVQPDKTTSTPRNGKNGSTQPPEHAERTDYGQYLHEQLRYFIDYNFSKKQQQHNGQME